MVNVHKLKTRGLNQVKRFLSNIDSQEEKKFKISYHGGEARYRSTTVVSSPALRWLESVIEGLPADEVDPEEIQEDLDESLTFTAVYLSAEKGEDTLNKFIETVNSQDVLSENFDFNLEQLETSKVEIEQSGSLPNAVNIYYKSKGDWIDITEIGDAEELKLLEGEYKFEAVYSDKVIQKQVDTENDSEVKLYKSMATQVKERVKPKKESNEETKDKENDSEHKEEVNDSDKDVVEGSESDRNKLSLVKLLKYGIFGAMVIGALLLFLPEIIEDKKVEAENPTPQNSTNNTVQRVSDVFNSTRVVNIVDARVEDARVQNDLSNLNNLDSLSKMATNHSEDMANENYLGHESSTGKSFEERLSSFNILCGESGENIARESWQGKIEESKYQNSTELADAIFEKWMNSDGERQKILNTQFKAHGIGIQRSSGEVFISQVFCG